MIEPAIARPRCFCRIFRCRDRNQLLGFELNAPPFQSGKDGIREAMPARLAGRGYIDQSALMIERIAGILAFLLQNLDDGVRDNPRGGRCAELVGDDLSILFARGRDARWCAGSCLPWAAYTHDVRTIRCRPPALTERALAGEFARSHRPRAATARPSRATALHRNHQTHSRWRNAAPAHRGGRPRCAIAAGASALTRNASSRSSSARSTAV
jgi:hypothetical protein